MNQSCRKHSSGKVDSCFAHFSAYRPTIGLPVFSPFPKIINLQTNAFIANESQVLYILLTFSPSFQVSKNGKLLNNFFFRNHVFAMFNVFSCSRNKTIFFRKCSFQALYFPLRLLQFYVWGV